MQEVAMAPVVEEIFSVMKIVFSRLWILERVMSASYLLIFSVLILYHKCYLNLNENTLI